MAVLKLFAPMVAVMVVLHQSLPTIGAVDSESNGKDQFEWQILSAKNFSSQIRLYPHVLLLVTVPWCGESRSLMREISQKVAQEQKKYSSLKLMLVHRNRDKVLAESLDAADGITLFGYWHSVSYKYQGSLRVQDILSSIHYLISLASEELPLKRLNNAKDMEMFLASADKAVILLESCGWTSKLLEKQSGNVTVQGDVMSGRLHKEINRTLASQGQKNLKVDMENEMMSCEVEDGSGRSPWVGEFSSENGTTSSINEDAQSTFGMSCSFEEYKKFESFFSKFMTVARALYLPPHRQRYGIISDRSLLSTLGVEVSDQWSLIIFYAGCPGCLRIVKEENHLDVLEMDDLPVIELEDKRNGGGPALPIDKPSVLLFVDRTSNSTETRRKCQEVLHVFNEVARQHWKYQVDGQSIDWPKRSSLCKYQVPANMLGNQRFQLSPSSPKMKLNDKMSIMIINEGKQVTLDGAALNLQSGSLHEILTSLLGQKKQSKLSSLAKEAGFQLLSDDVDIKIADVLSQAESQNHDSVRKSVEVSDEGFIDMNKDQTEKFSALVEPEKQSEPINIEASYNDNVQKVSSDVASKDSYFVDPHQSLNAQESASVVDVDSKVLTDVLTDESESLKHHFSGFTGPFFFSNGNYQFLRYLTNDSEVPRIVIIDPISQQHYVYHEVANFSFSSVSNFIDRFLNGTLTPYQRSVPLRNSVEMPQPPFVNLNFHEKDSVPCVTTDTFSEFICGSGQFSSQNATNAWHKDVLVLFGGSWCGVCQRMELVVREVYRALVGYVKMVKREANNKGFSKDDLKDVITKLPEIYSIDCTLNECGPILKSAGQSEVYPTLLLFPAKTKTVIPYDGNMMVTDIIKFLANHGSNSHLARLKGILWTDLEERDRGDIKFKDAIRSGSITESADQKDTFEAILKDGKLQNQLMFKLNEKENPVSIAVGSFLVATKNIYGSYPFNEARVLIVDADPHMGFQGLIVNKPISWGSVPAFEDAEMLKEARLSFGGPVIYEEMPLVSLTRNSSNNEYPQVLPGVYFLDQLATVNGIEQVKAGNQSATDYWFFWGYSGWNWDQLYSEIAAGVWSLHEGKIEDLQWTYNIETVPFWHHEDLNNLEGSK